MLKNGDVVVVRCADASKALEKYNKRRGVISKIVCSEGRPIAAYVTFKTMLVPIRFLEGISTIDHIRTLNILKHTVL